MNPSTLLLLIGFCAFIYSIMVDIFSDITGSVPARSSYATGIAFACLIGSIFAAHI